MQQAFLQGSEEALELVNSKLSLKRAISLPISAEAAHFFIGKNDIVDGKRVAVSRLFVL